MKIDIPTQSYPINLRLDIGILIKIDVRKNFLNALLEHYEVKRRQYTRGDVIEEMLISCETNSPIIDIVGSEQYELKNTAKICKLFLNEMKSFFEVFDIKKHTEEIEELKIESLEGNKSDSDYWKECLCKKLQEKFFETYNGDIVKIYGKRFSEILFKNLYNEISNNRSVFIQYYNPLEKIEEDFQDMLIEHAKYYGV